MCIDSHCFRSPAYPLGNIFPSSNLTSSSNTKPSRQMTDKRKEQQQAGKHFFMSILKPSKGRRIKTHSKVLIQDKAQFDFTFTSSGTAGQNEHGLGTADLAPGLNRKIGSSSFVETSCNMTVTEDVQEEGECIFVGGWCRYGNNRLKFSPVRTSTKWKDLYFNFNFRLASL